MADLAPFADATDLINAVSRPLTRDAALLAVERASGAVRGHCHWSISQETVTDRVVPIRANYTRSFWLPTLWLTSCTIVEGGATLVRGTDYDFDETGRVVRRDGTWWNYWMGEVVATYTHGYPEGDPRLENAKDVTLAVAARRVINPGGHSAESTGSESWSAGAGGVTGSLTEEEEDQLAGLVLEDLP